MMVPARELRPGHAHLWRLSLAVSAERLSALAATLARNEHERLAAFRAALPRERFVASRGLLRETLAGYTGAPPDALGFCTGAHGKPALAGEPDHGLRFNLAHSDDLLLIAIARGHEVGVDLERIRPILGIRQIAAALLTVAERDLLDRAIPEQRDMLFTKLWTRHEAIVKGEGHGLAHSSAPLREWSVFELRPEVGYQASLALAGLGWQADVIDPTGEGVCPWASFVKHGQQYECLSRIRNS